MFRRRTSGLPPDPQFPADLKKLGYFINEDDEIRNIEDPNLYFKYFITKNDRWNERQRFAMNQAIEKIVHTRLQNLGLSKIRLPATTTPGSQHQHQDRHVPVLATPDVSTAQRVVLIVGESEQDLGILAHRVIGGPGGIDKGSLVSTVRLLRSSPEQPAAPPPPAVVLANTGQLFWWAPGGRGLTPSARNQAPLSSAAHWGLFHDPGAHAIPGHETPLAHVAGVFDRLLGKVMRGDAVLDVVGLGDGADAVEGFLNTEEGWARWGHRLGCLAIVAGFYDVDNVKVEGLKWFLKERARAFICCTDPAGEPVAGAEGNPKTVRFTRFGCPVYSSGEPYYTESASVSAAPFVLDWMADVAREGEAYCNPEIFVSYADPEGAADEFEDTWASLAEEEKPGVSIVGDVENGGAVAEDATAPDGDEVVEKNDGGGEEKDEEKGDEKNQKRREQDKTGINSEAFI